MSGGKATRKAWGRTTKRYRWNPERAQRVARLDLPLVDSEDAASNDLGDVGGGVQGEANQDSRVGHLHPNPAFGDAIDQVWS